MIAPSLAWMVVTSPLRSKLAWPFTTCSPATSARAGRVNRSGSSSSCAIDRFQLRIGFSSRGVGPLEHERDQDVDLGVVAAIHLSDFSSVIYAALRVEDLAA